MNQFGLVHEKRKGRRRATSLRDEFKAETFWRRTPRDDLLQKDIQLSRAQLLA
jgi:hypothetical protein